MNRSVSVVMLLLAGLLPVGSSAAQAAVTLRGELPAELAATAAAVRARQGIPGLAVAVRDRAGQIRAQGFGLADVENAVPVTVDTQFRLASISKPVTAVIAWRLAQRGSFDLDQPVSEIVSQWPRKQWPVTTRQLLGHLGGVRHYAGGSEEFRSNRHYAGVLDGLPIFAGDPLLHEPGSRYRYTTYGFNLVGAVCVVSGARDFRALLQEEVCGPAGISALRFDDQDQIIRHRAQGYRIGEDGSLRNSAPVDTSNKVPGGGLTSTAPALAGFAAALLDDRLLDAAGRRALWTSQRTNAGDLTGYGMGFQVAGGPDGASWIVSHGGAQQRVSTLLHIDAGTGTVVVLLCNLEGSGAALRELAGELSAVLATLPGKPAGGR